MVPILFSQWGQALFRAGSGSMVLAPALSVLFLVGPMLILRPWTAWSRSGELSGTVDGSYYAQLRKSRPR